MEGFFEIVEDLHLFFTETMVLTRQTDGIAGLLKQSQEMGCAGFHQDRIVERSMGGRILTGERADPRRHAERARRSDLSEQTAFLGQRLQIRRVDIGLPYIGREDAFC